MSKNLSNAIIGHNGFQYTFDKNWVNIKDRKFLLKDCHEMVLASNGLLYMLGNETRNNILVFSKDGKIINSWGHNFPGGHGLSLHDENGEEFLYITDTVRSKILYQPFWWKGRGGCQPGLCTWHRFGQSLSRKSNFARHFKK